ncbi:MAG: hypothetical protein H6657_02555 [Ardenticatenaceae bacterium]|nr:hypothetical protein [Ardenticatenaceae bacterium]
MLRWLMGLLLVTAVTACQSPPDPTATLPPSSTADALSQVTTPTGYPLAEETLAGYPPPTLPVVTEPYPGTTPTAELIFTPPPIGTLDGSDVYLPYVANPDSATPTPLSPTETPSPTPIPTVDFTAVRTELAAQDWPSRR